MRLLDTFLVFAYSLAIMRLSLTISIQSLIFFSFALFFAFCNPFRLFAAYSYPTGSIGYDFSYPNCDSQFPMRGNFYVIGVTGGKAFTQNPCLGKEAKRFGKKATVYMNLNGAIGKTATNALLGPKKCKENDSMCLNFNYGFQAARDAYRYALSQGVSASFWWFDIETANSWNSDAIANQQVVLGAQYFFMNKSIQVGVYSATFMWQEIMGGWTYQDLPVWIAPVYVDANTASDYCKSENSFTGGRVALVQYGSEGFDTNYACI